MILPITEGHSCKIGTGCHPGTWKNLNHGRAIKSVEDYLNIIYDALLDVWNVGPSYNKISQAVFEKRLNIDVPGWRYGNIQATNILFRCNKSV